MTYPNYIHIRIVTDISDDSEIIAGKTNLIIVEDCEREDWFFLFYLIGRTL